MSDGAQLQPADGSIRGLCLQGLKDFFSGQSRVLEWGITPAKPTPYADQLSAWVGKGYHANMEYMSKRLQERKDPHNFHPWAVSAVVFSFRYGHPLTADSSPYRVAAYAQNDDYHNIARTMLQDAEVQLKRVAGLEAIRFYGFVDTAPVFERDLATEAGLGWRGKNCCTIHRTHGSGFHLAGFFLDIPLPTATPSQDFCGGCTRCLDQCPTDAFVAPGQLDANKCISYWTIEAKGEVPESLSNKFGNWVFGCDICQEVCPWNHKHLSNTQDTFPHPIPSHVTGHAYAGNRLAKIIAERRGLSKSLQA